EIVHQRYQPATPSFLNAGRARRGELISCFLIQSTDDMNSIGRTINSALQLSRIGGGVGINLSNLRGAGDPIKHIDGAASGVVPVMKLLEDSFSYSNNFIDRVAMNALYFADGNEDLAMDLADEIVHQRYQPATPSFLNAGRARRGELISCFLIQSTDDMNSIGRTINSALQLSRIGGGVGINLSNLRGAGDPIKHIDGAASGVVPLTHIHI
ncbi:hypothetical protein WP50_06385, partial [Lactiplantibacillus plantarum]